MPVLILLIFFGLLFGRTTIPGHGLTGWAGFYEAFAHIGVGVLLTLGFMSEWKRLALTALAAASLFELGAFLLQQNGG